MAVFQWKLNAIIGGEFCWIEFNFSVVDLGIKVEFPYVIYWMAFEVDRIVMARIENKNVIPENSLENNASN